MESRQSVTSAMSSHPWSSSRCSRKKSDVSSKSSSPSCPPLSPWQLNTVPCSGTSAPEVDGEGRWDDDSWYFYFYFLFFFQRARLGIPWPTDCGLPLRMSTTSESPIAHHFAILPSFPPCPRSSSAHCRLPWDGCKKRGSRFRTVDRDHRPSTPVICCHTRGKLRW